MGIFPAIDMIATGNNIARLRQRNGMTVQDLQNVFGFSTPQAIYKWQRGSAMPTLDNLVVLAAVFGTTLDAIIVRTGDAAGQLSA
ncbi:MAG: helix-turn-helix transcriptional regulator [Clostridia bacterium]|nr:helix-turn-helix transcriptional regulator [Clostridia bacterium]